MPDTRPITDSFPWLTIRKYTPVFDGAFLGQSIIFYVDESNLLTDSSGVLLTDGSGVFLTDDSSDFYTDEGGNFLIVEDNASAVVIGNLYRYI